MPGFKTKKLSSLSRQPQPGYVARGRIWVDKDGELYIGGGRARLLERIDEFGSIAAAARSMGLGYRNAWLWVETANRLATTPLVEKNAGGVGGGCARLTSEGRRVIIQYRELRAKFEDFLAQVIQK